MAKKTTRKATVKVEGSQKLTLKMPLDARKIKAIQRCIGQPHDHRQQGGSRRRQVGRQLAVRLGVRSSNA